ncbi:hypothetical protein HGQ17_12905 [Nesterenkonia sp. MY13]|uniref:Uncharacterized protein n=1 Tax=Nesterenkonia sedimenti TaxID=1463632 RepID=A0A7X8TLQ1_9MICC|nr:hypothetical protein [Nesterenkonia sedimenti]NLS10876.1 hypothetical protein [Nesterenkonia sedimenti]
MNFTSELNKPLWGSLAALSLVDLTACGGEDESEGDSGTAGGPFADGSADTGNDADEAPERSVQTYCKVWSDFESWADGVDDSDMSQLGVLVEELVDSLNRSAEVAPEEIQEESERAADAYSRVIAEIDTDDPDTFMTPEFQDTIDEIEADFEDLDGDFETIESYIQQECGLDPNEL